MPIPYAEPASTYLGALSAYGSGSVPSQKVDATWKQHNNPSDVTLTGSPASVASGTVTVGNATAQQVIVQLSVAAQGGNAVLHVDAEVDGVTLFPGGELLQGVSTDGSTIAYTFSFQTLVGPHTLVLLAWATGDGTLVVKAHQANLMTLVASAT